MNFREWILTAHRWLGLSSAIVLIVAGGTGAMLLWPNLFGRWPDQLHETLAVGRPGRYIVLAATAAAVALQLSGLYLWWRTRRFRVRTTMGWGRFSTDLHHAVGALGLVLMLLLPVTALGRVAGRQLDSQQQYKDLRQSVSDLHTTRGFSFPVKLLYAAASAGFVIQGVTGITMWWRSRR